MQWNLPDKMVWNNTVNAKTISEYIEAMRMQIRKKDEA